MKLTVKLATGTTGSVSYKVYRNGKYVGAGTAYRNGRVSFGHTSGAGWEVQVNEITEKAIADALADKRNSLYIQ